MSNKTRGVDYFVSIVIPVKNEVSHIEEALKCILDQEYPADRMEVLVAEGRSTDGSGEAVAKLAAEDTRIRLVDNPEGIVSTGLNKAIAVARGEIVIRMDAHCWFARDYVRECVVALVESGADNVGGPWVARGTGVVQGAIARAFQSVFWCGGARSHQLGFTGFVDSVYLGCWWKDTLLKIGGFDESLVRNQDDELNFRLIRAGRRVYQSARICSAYFPRKRIDALFRQYFQYGYWKVLVARKHRGVASWRHVVPVLWIVGVIGLGALGVVWEYARLGFYGMLVGYGLVNLLGSLWICRQVSGWREIGVTPAVLAACHWGYGSGFAMGVFDSLFRNSQFGGRYRAITR